MSEAGDESQFHYAWSTPAGGRAFESNANIDIHDSVVVNIGWEVREARWAALLT